MIDWNRYMEIAQMLRRRARSQDKDDLEHDIILALALAQYVRGEEPLSVKDMFRIANYECRKYWRRFRQVNRTVSLDATIDGTNRQLIDTLEDRNIVDIDAQITARMELMGYPGRLLQIGGKILLGQSLSNKEHQYLWRFRHKKDAMHSRELLAR